MLRQVLGSMIVGTIALIGVTHSAQSAQIQYTDDIGLSLTNWSDVMSIPLFDPALGVLVSVSFELSGHVEGSAKFESLDAAPATVTMNLAAEIELFRPDLSTLVTVLPLVETVDDVTEFDGIIDFGGTSGRTYEDLQNDAMESASTTAAADLALFTGVGTIDLPCDASGASTGSGAGNLILQFGTGASAEVIVTYEYEAATPTLESTWGQIKSNYR